jgi:hypothetical protein
MVGPTVEFRRMIGEEGGLLGSSELQRWRYQAHRRTISAVKALAYVCDCETSVVEDTLTRLKIVV